MRRISLIHIYKKILGYSLLLLFCGYLGSISLFPHTHIIDGFTIVHSHPYSSQSGSDPVKHDHSKEGFILNQFLSGFIATISILFFGVTIIPKILNMLLPDQNEDLIINFNLYSACLPRAPTS